MKKLLGLGFALALLAVLTWLGSSLLGRYDLTPQVWGFRATRVLGAALVGASLATGGAALQGLFRNPLAEPYLLGISSGAGVGVLLGRALAGGGLPAWATETTLAAVGGLATAVVVYTLAQRAGRLDPHVLLLSGVIVNVFNGAIILLLFLFVSPEEITGFIGWGMGRIPDWLLTRPASLITSAAVLLLGWGLLFWRASAMNVLVFGDRVAASLGVSVSRLRVEVFVTVALMTAASVAIAGPVGFVGLVVPHLARMLVGQDHRLLLLVAGFGGAILLMVADTGCRTLGQYVGLAEIPVGVVTALVGGPFFLHLLRRHRQVDP